MMHRSTLALIGAVLLGSCTTDLDVNTDSNILSSDAQQAFTTTSLVPVSDTHVRRGTPYYAYGTEGVLRVGSADRRKSLVAFSPAAISTAIAGRQIVSAHLELYLGGAVASFSAEQALVAHPLEKPFVETRATYVCADDTTPANWRSNCTAANDWTLESAPFPWRATGIPLAVTNGTTGRLRFDVTADIVDFKAGTVEHHGWVVTRTLDALGGEALFRSREASSGPRLVIVTEPEAVCGDGVRAGAEACDDGNTVAADGCTACIIDVCGDGVINNAGAEACDDGNTVIGDGCTACTVDSCGDGVVNNAGAEACDDGNTVAADGCTGCIIDGCGDGIVNNAGAEACDDGNAVDGDGCTACVIDDVGPQSVLLIGNSQLGFFGSVPSPPMSHQHSRRCRRRLLTATAA